MKKKIIYLIILVVLFYRQGIANTTYIYESTDIYDGDQFGVVLVYDSLDVPPIQTTINMYGGDISWLYMNNSSVANIYGGVLGNLSAMDLSKIYLYGGDIRQGFYGISLSSEIHVYGYNFQFDGSRQNGILSGNWSNGEMFSFYFHRTQTLPDQVTLHTIPAPSSLILVITGGIILRKRRLFIH